MKKIYLVVVAIMAVYFSTTILVFPQIYENMPTKTPEPRLNIKISEQKITLGQSFYVEIQSYNDGDEADLQIVSVGFPQNKNLDNVKIVEYNFVQSPQLIQIGEEVGSQYMGGMQTIKTKYPFVEAYSRPSKNGDSFKMTLLVKPDVPGVFKIYTKSVAMPHTSDLSHFPQEGVLDQQDEFVQEFIMDVLEP